MIAPGAVPLAGAGHDFGDFLKICFRIIEVTDASLTEPGR
jgi:hypothetical protein